MDCRAPWRWRWSRFPRGRWCSGLRGSGLPLRGRFNESANEQNEQAEGLFHLADSKTVCPTRAVMRWLAPEVVQTSNMDCGPASLKCLLEGFGVHASYGRLREACQTDVDGTSIDTIEDLAVQLG